MGGISAWQQRIQLPVYIAKHPANRGRVTAALWRALKFQVRARTTGKPSLADIGTLRILVYVGNSAATKVVYGCPPDYAEMQAWRRILEPGELFIDVGANVGTYALWAASCGARVVALEPDPHTFDRLAENVALNPSADITAMHAAANEVPGRVEVSAGNDTLTRIGPGVEVPAVTLDEVIERHGPAAGVKVDVEGFESRVLAGARQSIRERTIRVVQLEWNGASLSAMGQTREPIASQLSAEGYAFTRPDLDGRLHATDPTGFGADVFAVRQSDSSALIAD